MNIIKKIFAFLFGFKGSIGRKHYAIFLIIFTLLSYVYIIVSGLLVGAVMLAMQAGDTQSTIQLGIPAIILIIIWITLKFSHVVRRVHDLNMKAFNSKLFLTILSVEFVSLFLPLAPPYNIYIPWIGYICMIVLAFIPSVSNTNNEKFDK